MKIDRRDFVRAGALGGTGFFLGSWPSETGALPRTGSPPQDPKRILILGGTGFIGPPMVQYALSRGHEITIFNRGRTNTHLFPEVEKLVGDRNGDLTALEGRTWDVVMDNHATIPRWVNLTARLLRDAADQYIFVSSISVYAAEAKGYEYLDRPDLQEVSVNEASPVKTLPEGFEGEAVTADSYGPFKALAEEEARSAFSGRTTVVRPGLIAGPGDPTDRFTYWPVRVRRGGEVLAPGDGHDPTQFIDVRDLTEWVVHLAEEGVVGTFNALGPASRLSIAEMLYGIRAVTTGPVRFTWVDTAFLRDQGIQPWSELPLWIPADPLSSVDNRAAIAAGLRFRSLADTARDTLAWHDGRPQEQRERLWAGLSPEREAEVLVAWHSR